MPVDDSSEWLAKIRPDHPRLFFNRDTWPAVKERAEGPEREWYATIKAPVDARADEWAEGEPPLADHGLLAARAAFCYWMTSDERYLAVACAALKTSIQFYEKCYAERTAVNWYAYSRIHFVLAWDWLHDVLDPAERRALVERLVDNLDAVIAARVWRENISDHQTGYYGVNSCKWYVGVAAWGSGIRESLAREWLISGHDDHVNLLRYRGERSGEDGGAAAQTLGYAFGAYPHTEFSFFYTWLSATGENLAPQWPHVCLTTNYLLWNWIANEDGQPPLEFGYGDTSHTANTLRLTQLYSHMRNIRHFYSASRPAEAALARCIEERLPETVRNNPDSWFIYPFLQHDLEDSPPRSHLPELPTARHFPRMGQILMRSGSGPRDTYALFACGGDGQNHMHYDALHFTIHHRGFQALDTGTRYNELSLSGGRHIENYYCQTVAHNCVLIHLPNEPPASHWGVPRDEEQTAPNYGGQYQRAGSKVTAFETNELFTYVAGDATQCYRPEKCQWLTRQFVFLRPNHFIIFDRVVSASPEYRKDWLIHPASEPVFDGTIFRSEHRNGCMFCRTLLPEQAGIRVVGGRGNEFRTGDINWELDAGAGDPQEGLTPEQLQLIGQWRVEVSPSAAQEEDVFLHVIQVGDRSLTKMADAELIGQEGQKGVRLHANGRVHEVTFAATGALRGHIAITGNDGVVKPLP